MNTRRSSVAAASRTFFRQKLPGTPARPGSRRAPLRFGAGLLAALALAVPVRAATYYWTGDHDSFWNATGGANGTNWSSLAGTNSGTLGLPGSADDVFFIIPGAINLGTALGQDFSIRSLTFTSADTTPTSIGGANTLTLGTGGLTVNTNALITLNTNVALGAVQTWSNNSVTAVTVNGVISGAAGNNLTIAGTAAFTFTNAETYAGSTTIFTGTLNLGGAGGSLQSTSGITLNAGTSLVLDSSAANNSNRLNDSTTITTKGGILSLVGNGVGTTEVAGTLSVGSGASVVQTSGAGSSLTFGSGALASFSRTTAGGTVNFVAGAGSTIKAPNAPLANGIIGGWAVTGTAAGTGLNFATIDGSNNIVPYAAYTALTADGTGAITSAVAAADNTKYNATGNNSARILANTTINSLYMTGGSTLSGVTGGPTNLTFYNGITFGTGITANLGIKLTIGTGGIISSGATGIGHYNNKADIGNMAFIGYQFGEYTGTGQTNGDAGQITVGAGIPDLIVYTDSNLRIASQIVDNGVAVGLTKSGPGVLDLSNGNTQTNKPSNTFTGKVAINEGILLINQANQLGNSAAAADNVTFNGGELRTFAGFNTNTTQGWTVGTRGGAFSYTGGANAIVQNKITGVGGFAYYARQTGGGSGAVLHLGNTLGAGATANHDYQGATNFWFSYADGNDGSAGNATEAIIFDANGQVPVNSEVNINMIRDDLARTIVPNTVAKALNTNGKTFSFGSLAGNVDMGNFNGTLTLGGNNLSRTYTGAMNGTNNATAGTGILIKVGNGTQTLSGNNLYTGTTSINGGTLLIGSGTATTSATGKLGNTAVTVGNGTLTGALGGNGTIAGAVTVTSTGHLAPAMSATTSNTLTLSNNLTINAGATLDFNFGAAGTPGTGDLINLTGTGSLSMAAGTDVLNITPLAGFGIGTYNLITVSGTGTFTDNATFTINGSTLFNYFVLKPGDAIDGTAGGGTVPAGQLRLEVLAGNPNFFWTGAVNGAWDVNTTANWTGAGNKFTTGGNVTIDDANLSVVPPGATGITVVAGGVTANSIVFNNAVNNYTIGGGAITVTSGSGVTKNQAGSVTFNGNVTTPLTTINAGVVNIGGGATYSSATKLDLIGGILAVNGILNTPVLNVKVGTTLSVSGTGSLGSATALTLDGAAGFSNVGQTIASLADTGGATTGVLTLTGTAFTVGAGSFDGVIAGSGSLRKNTAGTLLLNNAGNSFNGTVTVLNGILSVADLGALGTGAGNITLGDAATAGTLQYAGASATLGRGVTLAAGGGSMEVTAAGQVLTVSGTITNGANTLTLLGAGNGNVAGVVTGAGNVVKQGSGEWALGNTGVAPGATAGTVFDVQGGTLTGMSNGTVSSLGGAAVTLSGGTLGLSSTATVVFDNDVSVTQNSALSAFQSTVGGGFAGQIITLGGTRNMTVANTKTVTLSSANNDILNVAGNITGAGGVTVGGGAVQFSGATYSYSGATAVTGGTLTAAAAINGTSGVSTSNAGVLVASGGLTTAGAIVTNNTSTFTAGGAVSAASVTLNNTSTFNANAAVTVGSVLVNGGTYNSATSLTAPGGVTILGSGVTASAGLGRVTAASGGLGAGPVLVTGSGATLQFDAGFAGTAAVAPSSITNNALLQVKTGTADLGSLIIGTGNAHNSAGTAEQLSERYFRPVDAGTADFIGANGDPGITFDNTANFGSRTPGGTGSLAAGTGLFFTGAQLQGRTAPAGLFPGTDNIGAAWMGTMTVGGANLAAGPVSFGTTSDDGSSIYVDLNQDGVFQTAERVVSNLGPHGNVTVINSVTLNAGTYKIAIGYYNGNGGQNVEARFAAGAGVAFASQADIAPGAAGQAGIFTSAGTAGSIIEVDAGATLSAGGFTAATVNLYATAASAATLRLTAPVSSAADLMNVNGTAPTAVLDLGTNNTVTAGTLVIAPGGSLTKTGNGRLVVSTLSSLQAGSALNVNAGAVELNGTSSTGSAGTVAASGTGTVVVGGTFSGLGTASGGGVLTGGGTYGSMSLASGGHLAPGASATPGVIGTVYIGGGVTMGAGAVMDFDFAALGTNDTGSIGGSLSLSGAETLNINALAGFSMGDYTLFTAIGPIGSTASFTFNVTGPGAFGAGYSIVTSGHNLLLHVSAPIVNRSWSGAIDNKWDMATANWSPTNPYDNNTNVSFNDGAANTNPINIIATVAPVSVTFNNTTATTYSIGGADISGGTGLVKNNNGTVILTSANTYAGSTLVSGGTLSVSADNNIGTAPGGATPGALTVNGGTFATTASFTLAATRGVAVGSSVGTINVAGGATLSYGGVIADVPSQAGALTKTGNGILALGGTNTYTGNTSVTGGTLSVAADNNLGAVPGAATPNSLTINGGTLRFVATTTLAATRGVTLGSSSGTVNVAFTAGGSLDAQTTTGVKYSGVIAGPGNLTVTGGTGVNDPVAAPYLLVLNGQAHSYGGSTLIDNATVTNDAGVTGGNILPATTVLTLNNHGVYAVYGNLNGFTLQTLAGLVGDSTGLIGTENNATATIFTINTAAATSYIYNGQIGDVNVLGRGHTLTGGAVVSLIKNGAGSQTLTGVNPYTGPTTINGGVLTIGADTAMGDAASAVTINNGATLRAGGAVTSNRAFTLGAGGGTIDTNGNSVTLGATGSVTGTTLTKIGGGALTISGGQTYATLNANGGVTNVNSALGTGASILNANATTNIGVSQTLAALNIADGVEVTFGTGLPFGGAPEKFGAAALIPEPGALGLLMVGALGVMSRRRRAR